MSLISYALIFYGFLSDVIIFDEKILPLEVIGAVVILASTMTVATIKLCEAYKQRKEQITKVSSDTKEEEVEQTAQVV